MAISDPVAPTPRMLGVDEFAVKPVEFLSDDQAAAYESFVGDLTRSPSWRASFCLTAPRWM